MNAPIKNPELSPDVLQFRKIGNSVGLILPKELLARLGFSDGDTVMVIEQPDKSVTLRRYDERHAQAMEAARWAMKEYAETFRELAK
jgi:putative addiction module antidote